MIAAAILGDLAGQHELDISVSNAGTHPDDGVNPLALHALRERGLAYEQAPRSVTRADIETADVVVSFGCVLGELPGRPQRWLDWSDLPDVSADVDAFCQLVEGRVASLLSG